MPLLWLLLFFGLTTGCAVPGDVSPALVVASDLDNLPFAGVAADGSPIGRDIEMMQLLAARTGHRLVWQRLPFLALLPALEAAQVDVVCATLGATREREQRVLFTYPYFETTIAVVVRTGSDEPRTLEDLQHRRVAAGAGTTSEDAVRRHLPAADGVFDNKQDRPTVERLLSRDVDAAVMDGPAADALVASANGRLQRLAAIEHERYALALPKDRHELRERLDRALRELRAAGELDRLDRQHGLSGR